MDSFMDGVTLHFPSTVTVGATTQGAPQRTPLSDSNFVTLDHSAKKTVAKFQLPFSVRWSVFQRLAHPVCAVL
jgi:hypothetical protein